MEIKTSIRSIKRKEKRREANPLFSKLPIYVETEAPDIKDIKIAKNLMKTIENQIFNSIDEAVLIYGNLKLSGRHIVWSSK
jgi:hypothetical protein